MTPKTGAVPSESAPRVARQTCAPESAKPWTGLGSRVHEWVADHHGDTFRASYTVRIGNAVHVLHAFQKKSKSGIATPRPDVERIKMRLKAVLAPTRRAGERDESQEG